VSIKITGVADDYAGWLNVTFAAIQAPCCRVYSQL